MASSQLTLGCSSRRLSAAIRRNAVGLSTACLRSTFVWHELHPLDILCEVFWPPQHHIMTDQSCLYGLESHAVCPFSVMWLF
jgi:hypothetical protein